MSTGWSIQDQQKHGIYKKKTEAYKINLVLSMMGNDNHVKQKRRLIEMVIEESEHDGSKYDV